MALAEPGRLPSRPTALGRRSLEPEAATRLAGDSGWADPVSTAYLPHAALDEAETLVATQPVVLLN